MVYAVFASREAAMKLGGWDGSGHATPGAHRPEPEWEETAEGGLKRVATSASTLSEGHVSVDWTETITPFELTDIT